MFVSSDTYPGSGGVLGLTAAGVADAKAKGITPALGAGFAYLRGPDDAIVEYQGNLPAERFIIFTCSRSSRSARSSGIKRI